MCSSIFTCSVIILSVLVTAHQAEGVLGTHPWKSSLRHLETNTYSEEFNSILVVALSLIALVTFLLLLYASYYDTLELSNDGETVSSDQEEGDDTASKVGSAATQEDSV